MGSYKLSGKAAQDLTGIYIFGIRNFGHSNAKNYIKTLENFVLELSERPSLARDASMFAHELKFYNFKSHVIFYMFTKADNILIVRVLGKHMNFVKHL